MRLVLALVGIGIVAVAGLAGGLYFVVTKSSKPIAQADAHTQTPGTQPFWNLPQFIDKPAENELASPKITQPIAAVPGPAGSTAFDDKIKPFLNKYCNTCHNSERNVAGVALDVYMNEAHAKKDRKTWEMVQRVIADKEMPPKKKEQPSDADRAAILIALDTITKVDCTAQKDPGRVTVRRLNKVEYNNTIRDLCGVDVKPAEDFPSDDVGYGFDNIGDVLSLQPILIEKYMAAADKILNAAIVPLDPVKQSRQNFRTQNIQVIPRDAKTRDARPRVRITTDGVAFLDKFNFPATGNYIIRIKAYGSSPDGTKPQMALRVDNKDLKTFDITAAEDKPGDYSFTVRVEVGEKRVAAAFTNPSDKKKLKPDDKPRMLGIEAIEVDGPIGGAAKPLPEATKKVLFSVPGDGVSKLAAAEKSIADFARRAYRRPIKPAETQRLMKLFAFADGKGESFEQAMKLPLKAILVSPNFLFRIEEDPKAGEALRSINEFELATRLSYFLWSTMPDEELFRTAERGELRKPGVLKAQIMRMLKDKKAVALTENFAGQWLMLRNIRTLTPDSKQFPSWDESLRNAIIRETEMCFEYIVANDRKVTELLDADYTFLNERLAKHYGIPGISGSDFRYVKLQDNRRGGIVTQASMLTVTSNPTRTSPVKRGKWVLENLLGIQPPPPAPDVPELPPVGEIKGSLRQQMELHRANPACATCHAKLDPLGFGLENFDAIGAWRDTDNKQKIDASGVLPDGSKFDGPNELRKTLLKKSDEFRRCLAEKLLTFALGRGLEYYDKCVLDDLTKTLKAENDTFSALVISIVQSDPFQKRQAKRSDSP